MSDYTTRPATIEDVLYDTLAPRGGTSNGRIADALYSIADDLRRIRITLDNAYVMREEE